MYRIPAPSADELNDYYTTYGKHVKELIQRVLNPGFYIEKTLGQDATAIKVRLGIIKGSYTEWFLNHYKEDYNLRKLLTSNIEGLLEIINHVQQHVPDFKAAISKTKYGEVRANQTIDDFNAICRFIFVYSFFDEKFKGETIFNRTEFIKNRNLTICPYCGASYIRPSRFDGKIKSTPDIDHYFPKSAYPFLALSYYNLIPSCRGCNTLSNKGIFDPYEIIGSKLSLAYPYSFNHESFSFRYRYSPPNQYDPDSFEINIEYNDKHLRRGYTVGIAIEDMYLHDPDTPRLWGHMMSVRSKHYRNFARNLFECYDRECIIRKSEQDSFFANIKNIWMYWSPEMSKTVLKYKFKKDILFQMLKDEQTQRLNCSLLLHINYRFGGVVKKLLKAIVNKFL